MITYSEAKIEELWIHFVGNASQDEGIQYCNTSIVLPNEVVDEMLKQYFFGNFKEPEFYAFDFFDGNIDLNPMYNYVRMVFEDPDLLGEQSVNISKFLYENSKHPNIKSGDLMIAYVKDILIEDKMMDGICVFKSENKQPFLNLEKQGKGYYIRENEGLHPGKLDKACLILNSEASDGYRILALDHANRSKDAQFWKEKFLNLKPRSDDYHYTKQYIQATKAFVKDRLQPLYDIDKTQEAEILNHSLDFLKNEEELNQAAFDERVFKDPNVINEFQLFKLDYQQENEIELADGFKVSNAAVKNQSKVFKSVLKLDKNFHIYIHGNRSWIEKGTDPDGRKFYKIYYEEEN
ncbi:nucleoid-associated protein [Portibacter marinus]|uniref:nucleoid-associated protein n=1 Tax=Portibacter marinus TaxID=2898660 RepID=UPI001F237952|nr:nucleoid-associated protein [Portibacter marinus]